MAASISGNNSFGIRNPQIGSVAAVSFHPRERQQPGDVAGAPDKKASLAEILPPNLNLAGEQNDHMSGWIAVAEQTRTAGSGKFLGMVDQPQQFLFRQSIELANLTQRIQNFMLRGMKQGPSRRNFRDFNDWLGGGFHGLFLMVDLLDYNALTKKEGSRFRLPLILLFRRCG
jgi:hypothetical protein